MFQSCKADTYYVESSLHERFWDSELSVDKIVLHDVARHWFQKIFIVLLSIDSHVAFYFHAVGVEAERQYWKESRLSTARSTHDTPQTSWDTSSDVVDDILYRLSTFRFGGNWNVIPWQHCWSWFIWVGVRGDYGWSCMKLWMRSLVPFSGATAE